MHACVKTILLQAIECANTCIDTDRTCQKRHCAMIQAHPTVFAVIVSITISLKSNIGHPHGCIVVKVHKGVEAVCFRVAEAHVQPVEPHLVLFARNIKQALAS